MQNVQVHRFDALRAATVVGVLLLLAGLGVAAAGHPSAAVSTGSGAPQQWAYGSDTWYNTTSLTSTYSLHEVLFYGSQVVTTATNTSRSTVELKALSATAFTESYLYCAPNCTSPTSAFYNLSLDEWSSELSFVNVTSQATVYENNSSATNGVVAASAYGISNATWISGSNYSEQYVYDLDGALDYQGTDYSQTNSTYEVAFHPSLGLIPWTVAKNLTWNSTSNVTASYLAKTGYSVTYAGLHNYSIDEYGMSYTKWNIPETESVSGLDLGNGTLPSGANVTNIELGFSGALDVSDGIFASPVSEDLFGGATGNWSVGVVAGALAHTAAMSIVGGALAGSYRIVASATLWTAPIRMVGLSAGSYTAPPSPIAAPSSGSSQAEPESVSFAQAQANCLVHSCGGVPVLSAPSGSGGLALPAWAFAVIGGGAAAVLGAFALRWRSRAPPRSPSPSEAGSAPPPSPR
jgi:hypothetical protein